MEAANWKAQILFLVLWTDSPRKLTENIYYSLGIKGPSRRVWRLSLTACQSISHSLSKTKNFSNVEVNSRESKLLYMYKILRDYICESCSTNSFPWPLLEFKEFLEENENSLSLPIYSFLFGLRCPKTIIFYNVNVKSFYEDRINFYMKKIHGNFVCGNCRRNWRSSNFFLVLSTDS